MDKLQSETKITIQLRPVLPADLPIFFRQQQDPIAIFMAAFTAKDPLDRPAFDAHWEHILNSPEIRMRTIMVNNRVAGNVAAFNMLGQRTVSYWLGRGFWGRGVATRALAQFLSQETTRPLFARVVHDNIASQRVLEKGGFLRVGRDRGFANGRGEEVTEYIFALKK